MSIHRTSIGVYAIGLKKQYLLDIYHYMMEISWTWLLFILLGLFLILNLIFTFAYLSGGDCIQNAKPGYFPDIFFFSVQTLTTIGYGNMYPKTQYAQDLVFFEAFTGLIAEAMTTGLMFSKFSIPTARVIFSQNVIIAPRNNKSNLSFRVANQRGNQIAEAQITVTVLIPDITTEGDQGRKMVELSLVRRTSPIFTLSWSIFHIIDENSPLFNKTLEDLEKDELQIIVSLIGLDNTSGQTVHARHIYSCKDIVWNKRFVDILGKNENGKRFIDYRKFHELN